MSYYDEDECPECGKVSDCDESCINYVHTLTMSKAIEHARFSGNCYCLMTLREVNIPSKQAKVRTHHGAHTE